MNCCRVTKRLESGRIIVLVGTFFKEHLSGRLVDVLSTCQKNVPSSSSIPKLEEEHFSETSVGFDENARS